MAGLIEMATLCWKADFDSGKLNLGVKNAESQIGSLKDKTSGISDFLNKSILGGVLGITGGLAGMATVGLKSAMDLQTSMKGFQAQTGMSADETDKVKNSVKNMFVATGKSYDELAKMATGLHNELGMSSSDIDKYETSFSKYAKVTKQDTSDMVTAIGGIKNAWHLSNADIQPLMDKLILSQQKYGLSVNESQQSLKTLAPAFSAIGMNVNQAVGYLDLFHKAGLNSESATIAFQTALKKVKNPEELQTIITKMQNTKDNTERAKLGMETFGKQGLAMAQALKPGSASLADIQKSLEGATGATDKASSAMGGTLATTVAKLKRTLQDFLEGTMEKMLPSIQGFANGIQANMPTIQTTMANAFNIAGKAVGLLGDGIKFATDHSNILIPVVAGLAGGLGALKVAGMVTTLIDAWNKSTIITTISQEGLNAAIKANPLNLWITIIGLAITAGVALYQNWDKISAFASKMWTELKDTFGSIGTSISDTWNNAKQKTEETWNNIKQSTSETWNGMKTGVEEKFNDIKASIGNVWDNIKTQTGNTWDNIKENVDAHGGGIKGIIGTYMDGYKNVWEIGFNFINTCTGGKLGEAKASVSNILGTIHSNIQSIFGNIESDAKTKWENVKYNITHPVEAARDAVKNALDAIKGFFTNLHLPEIKIPSIKLPHFSISGSFSLNPPSIPTFGCNWYDKGGIFNSPQIIGVGEKRPEFVGALDDLKYLIRSELDRKSVQSNNSSNTGKTVQQTIQKVECNFPGITTTDGLRDTLISLPQIVNQKVKTVY